MRRNWWRDWVVSEWRCADAAWQAEREQATCGYAAEMLEWERDHPRPTLKTMMMALADPAGA